jgi:hypothetical protein
MKVDALSDFNEYHEEKHLRLFYKVMGIRGNCEMGNISGKEMTEGSEGFEEERVFSGEKMNYNGKG